MHAMSVKSKYYNLLKSGEKKIELRLLDEKRQNIKIGDEILFSDASNKSDQFNAKVINLHKAKTFANLCDIILPKDAGFETKEELINVLEEFYSLENQEKYGVVGIQIILL